MDEVVYPVHGSCQCGGVTFELLAAPQKVVACHCRECQKLSTSAFSITAVVKASDLRIKGELKEWSRIAESGNTNAAAFCPVCGNRIYHYDPAQPDTLKFKPSSLSDTRMVKPTVHVWVKEKQDWFQIPHDVEVFEGPPR